MSYADRNPSTPRMSDTIRKERGLEPAGSRSNRERADLTAEEKRYVKNLRRAAEGKLTVNQTGELTDEQISTLRAAIDLADSLQGTAPSIAGLLRSIEPALDQHVERGPEREENRRHRRASDYLDRQPNTPRISERLRKQRGLDKDPVRVIEVQR